jgi:phospholipase C
MLENRSFDNILGWLYDPNNAPPFNQVPNGQQFDGLSGKTLTNPVPASHGGGTASPGKETILYYPNPDPGEPYNDVYQQLFNENPPPSQIPNRTDVPGMQGFVNNYAANVDAYNNDHSFDPILTDPRIIMNGYTPATLPVLNGLANAYAVCDHWFCSVPSETFCNRSFVHAGTSSGYVYNSWSTGKHDWDFGFLTLDPT